MKRPPRWAPLVAGEKPSPCKTVFFNPDARYPGRPVTPPIPHKLTDRVSSIDQGEKDAWIELVRSHGPWGWFCLLTFRTNVLEKTAHHRFMRWIRGINEELYGRRYREQGLGVRFARATEYHQNGRIHYHVLISQEVRRLRRLSYKDYWEYGFPRRKEVAAGLSEISVEPGNGFARIRDYDIRKAGLAEKYLLKYVTKERDIFVYRPLRHPETEKSSK